MKTTDEADKIVLILTQNLNPSLLRVKAFTVTELATTELFWWFAAVLLLVLVDV